MNWNPTDTGRARTANVFAVLPEADGRPSDSAADAGEWRSASGREWGGEWETAARPLRSAVHRREDPEQPAADPLGSDGLLLDALRADTRRTARSARARRTAAALRLQRQTPLRTATGARNWQNARPERVPAHSAPSLAQPLWSAEPVRSRSHRLWQTEPVRNGLCTLLARDHRPRPLCGSRGLAATGATDSPTRQKQEQKQTPIADRVPSPSAQKQNQKQQALHSLCWQQFERCGRVFCGVFYCGLAASAATQIVLLLLRLPLCAGLFTSLERGNTLRTSQCSSLLTTRVRGDYADSPFSLLSLPAASGLFDTSPFDLHFLPCFLPSTSLLFSIEINLQISICCSQMLIHFLPMFLTLPLAPWYLWREHRNYPSGPTQEYTKNWIYQLHFQSSFKTRSLIPDILILNQNISFVMLKHPHRDSDEELNYNMQFPAHLPGM